MQQSAVSSTSKNLWLKTGETEEFQDREAQRLHSGRNVKPMRTGDTITRAFSSCRGLLQSSRSNNKSVNKHISCTNDTQEIRVHTTTKYISKQQGYHNTFHPVKENRQQTKWQKALSLIANTKQPHNYMRLPLPGYRRERIMREIYVSLIAKMRNY